ncbi:phage Mu protein F like protein (pseudogene) [Staphylococcus aureus]|uniref:minor capsid protein n=1 Tax=Staphylococcus aureus TaxID=1280 RepID=UPI0007CA396F|nr:minor capsid protein [Staphylococcus aureus]EJX3543364.1 minor capsid protein [Staphylococcus aureus]MCQ1227593.1 minor capsid protein [Staphylococcus aureus]MCS5416321.1 minor capsid protein [Staphylococcus aureus]SAO42409.1 phage Mu protein F like protein (pseudogene) [Staphylococcus aureus]SGR65255.1 phage Mu protein F like protein (pseudogene) [Staphylococcus aureus]
MSDNSKYWLERAQNVIQSEIQADAEATTEIERIILQMYAEIAKELLAFYAKYASTAGLTMLEVKKNADAFDVKAFRHKAKMYVRRKDFSGEANRVLKLYNLTMKISREQLLKQQLDLIVRDTGLNLQSKLEDHLVEAVDREVERQAHILGEHVKIDDAEVKAVVNSNFKGVTWSQRIWKDMALVQKEVEQVTSHVLIRGRHPNEFVPLFKKKTQSTTYNASRLLVTESARVQAESQKLTYLKELGEDGEYKYVAKIDSKTSKLCHSLNGKIFKVKDMIPGVNAPPMHPWCRSTTVPHVGNWRDKFFNEREGKYQVEVKEAKLQEKAKNQMKEMIESGKIKIEINPEKQQRHILNTNEYNNKKNNSSFLPSYITIDSNEIEKVTKKEFIDFPVLYDDEGNFRKKQVIDYKKIIGKSYVNGKYIETKLGKVHYSKTGFHVVPYIKKE